MSLNSAVARSVREWVTAWPDQPTERMLYRVFRYLAQWRSIMLANTYVQHHGPRVFGGIFQGMEYVAVSSEGALLPRLLGVYEAELHPHLLAWAEDPPDVVLDIGCAEGYYAVGLARLYRSADVYAFDIDPKAREACAQLASRNGVSDRVHVGGEFSPADFAGYAGRRGLVIVDAEGAELDILRPDLARDLVGMHIIVETHDVYRPGALRILVERFSPTHDITQVDSAPKVYEMPGWLKALNPLDQLLAAWEWRLQPTPWLVMSPKQP